MNRIKYKNSSISPSKVVCIGRNYVAHIKELDNAIPDQAVIFIKPNSAISNELLMQSEDEIHYEGEISFLIQSGEIAAVAFGLDLTKRAIQSTLKEKSLPWERAKAFDGSAVFSEFVPVEDNLDSLRLTLNINGELTQEGGCELMLFKPDEILNDVKSFITLEDGDILMTGTPAGVGKVNSGDTFEGSIFSADKLLVRYTWNVA